MNRFLQYLKTQYLRSFKLYPAILICAVVMVTGIGLAASSMFTAADSSAAKSKTRVGIVGDFKHSYLEIGVEALKTQDASKEYLEFVEMEEETARAALEAGELTAYLRIPDNFIKDVIRGKDVQIAMVMRNTPAVIKPVLMKEVAGMVSHLVVHSQGGIYGLMDAVELSQESYADAAKLSDELTVDYFAQILSREECWEYEYIGVGNELPLKAYYVCVFLILICLLWGVTCSHLLIKTDLSLPRMLKFSGLGEGRQVLADFLPFFTILYSGMVLVFGVWGAVKLSTGADFGILNQPDTVGQYLMVGLGMLPAVLLLAAMQYLLFELCSHIISGVLLQILSLLALSYASGFLYPVDSLPPAVQTLSDYLPTGAAFDYTVALLNNDVGTAWLRVTAYGLLLLAAAVVVRRLRIGGRQV